MKDRKQSNCSAIEVWLNELWYSHITEKHVKQLLKKRDVVTWIILQDTAWQSTEPFVLKKVRKLIEIYLLLLMHKIFEWILSIL